MRMIEKEWIGFLLGFILFVTGALLFAIGTTSSLESNMMWIAGLICLVVAFAFFILIFKDEYENNDEFEWMRL